MRRCYVDLHLKPKECRVEEMLEIAAKLGFRFVGVNLPEESEDIPREYKGVKVLRRVDIEVGGTEFKNYVARLSRRFDLVAATCRSSKDVRKALNAGIKLICFRGLPLTSPRITDFSLIEARGGFFEVDASLIIEIREEKRSSLLRSIARIFRYAGRKRAKIVLASGAEKPWMLRAPMDLASVVIPAGISWDSALRSVTENPCEICMKSYEKITLPEGIRIVKRW